MEYQGIQWKTVTILLCYHQYNDYSCITIHMFSVPYVITYMFLVQFLFLLMKDLYN